MLNSRLCYLPLILRLAFWCTLLVSPSPGTLAIPGPQEGSEEEAQEGLAKALRFASRGNYKEAHRRYQRLAKEFPGTRAGLIALRRSAPSAFISATDIVRHGPSSNRVDIVLMGEGYTLKHQRAWNKLAEDIPPYFERQKTLGEYFSYFNFIRANLISAEEGVDGYGREYDTALNGKMRDTYAGHVGVERKRVFAMLDELPDHDGQAIVYVRRGKLGTGGSGVATIGGQSTKTTIHEFGHSFGRLADEYTQETHKRGLVGMSPNVSNTDERAKLPWKHWLDLRGAGIDVYAGAAGRERGAWKPTSSGCVMSSTEFFCRVCRERLVLQIYSHVDPIDRCSPPAQPFAMREFLVMRQDRMELSVHVMQPASHKLEVEWWILPEEKAPRGAGTALESRYGKRGSGIGGRAARGPLATIRSKPEATTKPDRDGKHTLILKHSRLKTGRYRVVVRVHDTTEFRGERYPWVLKDEDQLLWSERAWWIEVKE